MTTGTLNTLDYTIFVVYFSALVTMSWWFSRSQESKEDYFLGGRDLPWWAVGISTAATQTSAIGFMSIPAFVAMKEGGGLKLLQGEFALPLSMIFVMIFFIPFFRKLELISVYEYLEMRFGPSVKYLVSGVFLLSRGLGTAVGLYMTALVFSVVFQFSFFWTVIVIGIVTLVYDTLGGMKAVVYSDVIQMFIIMLGALVIVAEAVSACGGPSETLAIISGSMSDRVQVLDFGSHGLGDGAEYSFWPQFFGGFFLLAAYYGCDQTQTQRELSAKTLDDTRNSLIFNGYFRFPLSLLYAGIGLALGAFVTTHPDFAQAVLNTDKVDNMLPMFIMNYIPHGLKALIFVAVLAAAMSSLDSSINSLSASTLVDFIKPLLLKGEFTDRTLLIYSKVTTVGWGLAVTVLAFYVGNIGKTIIDTIQMVGSAFYGPILAAFLAGVCIRQIHTGGITLGILCGVGFNVVLHQYFSGVFWMWWNAIGCLVTVGVAFLYGVVRPRTLEKDKEQYIIWNTPIFEDEKRWLPKYGLLLLWLVLMILISWAIPKLLGG
jgi:SSS family transporter